ncbi:unnamed protein product [Cuscuta europaea]|uniref:Uncharacterized protein n=1 Tax=Cuscuta europaea TaxID=41803 RepID=A0A9P0ZIK8_CUSEU|nr:unnamed protein product [Cuscuta europaea]
MNFVFCCQVLYSTRSGNIQLRRARPGVYCSVWCLLGSATSLGFRDILGRVNGSEPIIPTNVMTLFDQISNTKIIKISNTYQIENIQLIICIIVYCMMHTILRTCNGQCTKCI